MVSRAEVCRRQFEHYRRYEASSAPRKRPTVAPVGVIELIDRRRQHVQDVKELLERYEAALVDQETRRLKGLAFAPDEGKRSAYHALEILDELCKELRSET